MGDMILGGHDYSFESQTVAVKVTSESRPNLLGIPIWALIGVVGTTLVSEVLIIWSIMYVCKKRTSDKNEKSHKDSKECQCMESKSKVEKVRY